MQLNAKTLRIIFLILVPSLIAICSYVYGYYYFGSLSSGNYFYLSSTRIAFVTLIPALICYILVVVYGAYPVIFTTEKYIKKQGYQNLVTEFEFIKKNEIERKFKQDMQNVKAKDQRASQPIYDAIGSNVVADIEETNNNNNNNNSSNNNNNNEADSSSSSTSTSSLEETKEDQDNIV